jgi:hypothetical protein
MRRLALTIAVALAAGCVPAPTTTASPSASPSPTARATPTVTLAAASPSPAPTPSFSGPLRLTRVTIPQEVAYEVLPYGNDATGRAIFRLVVFDLGAGRLMEAGQVAVDQPSGSPVQADVRSSASRDGRVVVLTATQPSGATTIYAVRPETAEFRQLAAEPAHYGDAVVSPDGSTYAFTGASSDAAVRGIWVGPTTGGPVRQLVRDIANTVPPAALAFSDGTEWLAFTVIFGEGDVVVGVVRPTGSARIDRAARALVGDGRLLGAGSQVDWRGGEKALLVRSGRSLFGGVNSVASYDVVSGRARELYRPTTDIVIDHVAWHPAVDRYVEMERPCCMIGGAVAWLRYVDGRAPVKLADGLMVSPPWWSRDGSRLFALVGGDDSQGGVTDLLTRRSVLSYCKRSLAPPCT